MTDYVGLYGLVNPWTDFLNLAFSTEPTTPAPDQSFGAAMRWNPADHYYILAGLADANGDPSDPGESIDAFFSGGEYFKHLEAGWFGDWDTRFEQNIHLTLWHADERKEAGIPDGWGMQFSFNRRFDAHWLPFLRVGYGDGGGAPLERSVSVGFAYYGVRDDRVFGLGLNSGRPHSDRYDAQGWSGCSGVVLARGEGMPQGKPIAARIGWTGIPFLSQFRHGANETQRESPGHQGPQGPAHAAAVYASEGRGPGAEVGVRGAWCEIER